MKNTWMLVVAAAMIAAGCAPAAGAATPEPLVVYSGRSEALVGPELALFEQTTGIPERVRWGSTAERAATLLEEGEASPADVFYAQDPGGLGALAERLAPLPQDLLARVHAAQRDEAGRWVGITGRARVITYNTARLSPADLPADLWDLTDPAWAGRVGWAPTNASFQAMAATMRALWGEAQTLDWLTAMAANNTRAYESNSALVAAVGAGEIDMALVNHYYLYRFLEEQGPEFPARNHFLRDGGPGSLVLVSGAGVLRTARNPQAAERLLAFLLSPVAQQYFAGQTHEYPLVEGAQADAGLPALADLTAPGLDLTALAALQVTLDLLRRAGLVP